MLALLSPKVFFQVRKLFKHVVLRDCTTNVFGHGIELLFLNDFVVKNCAVRLFSDEPSEEHLKDKNVIV